MLTGIDPKNTAIRKKEIVCQCPHPKAPNGLHTCKISGGLTHDYCCHEREGCPGMQCDCRIQNIGAD